MQCDQLETCSKNEAIPQQIYAIGLQVLKLRAICSHCQKEAAFTHRLGNEKDVEVPLLPPMHIFMHVILMGLDT